MDDKRINGLGDDQKTGNALSYNRLTRNGEMIEILEIFWNAPIELRVIILAVPIVFILLAYLGISGTNESIDFQNRMWRDEEWRKKNE